MRRRDDRGAVAVMVAPVLLLVVVPLLAVTLDVGRLFVSRSAEQNAADQAAKAAAWAACNDRDPIAAGLAAASRNGFRSGTDTSLGTVTNVTVAARGGGSYGATISVDVDGVFSPAVGVESTRVSARAAASCQTESTPSSALYAHSTCATSMRWTGNNISVTGGVHTNGTLRAVGNEIDVVGSTTYGVAAETIGHTISFTPSPARTTARTWPLWFDIADFDNSPAGRFSTRPEYVSAGSADIDNAWLHSRGYLSTPGGGTLAPKIYYTDGNITINGNGVIGTATFVARGAITFPANTSTIRPLLQNLAAFSAHGAGACNTDALRLTGNHLSITGIVFTPYGRTSLIGNDVLVEGTIVANSLQITADDKTVRAGPGSSRQINPYVSLDAW